MKSPEFSPKIVKKFIEVGLVAAMVAGGAGCAEKPKMSTPSPIVRTTEGAQSLATPEIQDGKEFLARAISELPNSPIKEMLDRRVSPFLQKSQAQSIDFPGISIPAQNFTVSFIKLEKNSPNPEYSGIFDENNSSNNLPSGITTKENRILVPYVGFMKPGENISSQNMKDGTAVIQVTIPAGEKITSGFSPKIIIGTRPDLVDQKMVKFVIIKESTQFAVNQIIKKMMIEKMNALGQPVSIEVIGNNGLTSQLEIISGVVHSLASTNSRFLAATDAAASVIAIKAYSPEEVKQILSIDSNLLKVVAALSSVDLGSDENSIVLNALNWVLTNPLGETLPHNGDFNKIP